jgi:hypothetical protein
MNTLPAAGPAPQIDDDQAVPEDLIGRLYNASESAVFDMLPELSLQDRAYLAMFCYRKSHLHRIGLAIAATCDETALVATWGTALGQTLYAQSREKPPAPLRAPGPHRAKVTLAALSGNPFVPLDDEDDAHESADAPGAITIALS